MYHGSLQKPKSSNAASWAVIGSLLVLVLAIELTKPLAIDPRGLYVVTAACAALAVVSLFYSRVRIQENFSAMCVCLMQVVLFSVMGSILSYLLAREGGPLWDQRLAAWDRALGFDWLAYVRWVDDHGLLAWLLRAAYASLIPQIIVIVFVLGVTMRLDRLRMTMLAAILSGSVTVILSSFFPAVSNFVYLGLTARDFQQVDPFAGYVHLADFTGLRNGRIKILNLRDMQGIVTFPSYHAALATVTCWSFWGSGFNSLKWLGSAVAVATIVATPIDGGHYLVDILAGMAIAAVSIAVARRMVFWCPSLPVTASPSRR